MHWTAIPDSPDMLRPRFVFETNHNRLSLQKTGLTSAHLPHHTAFLPPRTSLVSIMLTV